MSVIVGGAFLLCGLAAQACNIPVFRYALENWHTDPYYALVVSRGPLDESQQQAVEKLTAAAASAENPANLKVVTLDLSRQDAAEVLAQEVRGERAPEWLWQQWKERLEALPLESAQMVVLYPHDWDRAAWQVPFSTDSASQLLDSPLRQEIASRLLGGQSAVWVLLESGDAAKDDAAWEQLQTELKNASQTVTLPSRELIEAEAEYRPDVEIELRVEFSAVRLARADAAEAGFDSTLRGSEPDLRSFTDPIAVPVFGRGRTYYALVGKGIRGETIEENCQFLCGACSCQVKNENPGVDLLMAVNWNDKIGGSAMPEFVLPELTGIGALDVSSSRSTTSTAAPKSPTALETNAKTPATPPTAARASVDQTPADLNPADSNAVARIADAQDTTAGNTAAASDTNTVPATGALTGAAASDVAASPVADETEASEITDSPHTAPSDLFQRRLVNGVVGGIGVAVFFVVMATYALRR